ncbi:hypothetical protein TPY_3262 [Sulfobacillus acidophilus TPY]|nr:hypothetical protein TPY_3262 [Sulfobacillus acidophilus TPY]
MSGPMTPEGRSTRTPAASLVESSKPFQDETLQIRESRRFAYHGK